MKRCFRCLKFLVTFFNGLILLLGLAIESFFLWVYFNTTILSEVTSHTTYILYFFMALGSIMTMMGFLGCCGALQESRCLLGTFFFLTLVLFGGQVAICIWSYLNFKYLENNFKTSLNQTMNQYYIEKPVESIINTLQKRLKCCGSAGPRDWLSIQPIRSDGLENRKIAPTSCCRTMQDNCNSLDEPIDSNSLIYHQGCSEKLFKFVKEHKEILLAVALGVSLIQVFALIFSLVLCISFGKIEHYYDD